jgi:hypothetical protein
VQAALVQGRALGEAALDQSEDRLLPLLGPAGRDVADHHQGTGEGGRAQRDAAHAQDGPVVLPAAEGDVRPAGLGGPGRQQRPHACPARRREERLARTAQDAVQLDPHQRAQRLVRVHDPALGIDQRDALGQRVDDEAERLERSLQRLERRGLALPPATHLLGRVPRRRILLRTPALTSHPLDRPDHRTPRRPLTILEV